MRHKILDAIGDIYLMGGEELIGHYHGVKAGHAMNNKILHVLFSQADAFEIVELGAAAPRNRIPAALGLCRAERSVASPPNRALKAVFRRFFPLLMGFESMV